MRVPRLKKRVSRGSTSGEGKDARETGAVTGCEGADLGVRWIVGDRGGRDDVEEVFLRFHHERSGGGAARMVRGGVRGAARGRGHARVAVPVGLERFRLNSPFFRVISALAPVASSATRVVHRRAFRSRVRTRRESRRRSAESPLSNNFPVRRDDLLRDFRVPSAKSTGTTRQ